MKKKVKINRSSKTQVDLLAEIYGIKKQLSEMRSEIAKRDVDRLEIIKTRIDCHFRHISEVLVAISRIRDEWVNAVNSKNKLNADKRDAIRRLALLQREVENQLRTVQESAQETEGENQP